MKYFFLLVILAGAACALSAISETKCDPRQFFVSCNPAPGETVFIKLMDNATGYVLLFSKDLTVGKFNVFMVRNGTVKICESYKNRTEFSIDTGTLKITDVEKEDAGQYTLTIYTPRGIVIKMLRFTLNVKGKNGISIKIPIPAVLGVLILILVACVVWKLKPCKKRGYQTLH